MLFFRGKTNETKSRIQTRAGSKRKLEKVCLRHTPASESWSEETGEGKADGYDPQKERQEAGLERFLLPRPCRLVVERVCILASQLGVGKALPGDLRH